MQTQSEMQGWTHAAVQQVERPEEQVSGRTQSPDELNSEVKRHIGLDCGWSNELLYGAVPEPMMSGNMSKVYSETIKKSVSEESKSKPH